MLTVAVFVNAALIYALFCAGITCAVYSTIPPYSSCGPATVLNSLLYLVLLLLIFPQLVLRDNDLIELPKEIAQMTKLKELHIQNNRLTLLPPELGMFPCALSFICSSEVGVVCL